MSEYDGRMIVAQKNIESIFTALNHFEAKRAADASRVEQLMATVTQLTQQQQQLQVQLNYINATIIERLRSGDND